MSFRDLTATVQGSEDLQMAGQNNNTSKKNEQRNAKEKEMEASEVELSGSSAFRRVYRSVSLQTCFRSSHSSGPTLHFKHVICLHALLLRWVRQHFACGSKSLLYAVRGDSYPPTLVI